jgi:hypothetical protein
MKKRNRNMLMRYMEMRIIVKVRKRKRNIMKVKNQMMKERVGHKLTNSKESQKHLKISLN